MSLKFVVVVVVGVVVVVVVAIICIHKGLDLEPEDVEELDVQLQEGYLIQIIFNFPNWSLNFALLFLHFYI